MSDEKNEVHYYLSASANFFAACGGGMVLGKGMTAIANVVHGGSILAFFIGTLLGLFFLHLVPKSWSKTIASSFSFCGA